jgi:acetyltransferase
MVQFHETLSERSIYMRYFHHLSLSERISHERLTRICFAGYDRQMVLVAEAAPGHIVAVGRLNREPGESEAEFAIIVSDQWQYRGLGRELLDKLIRVAAQEKIRRIYGQILPQNRPMLDICREAGLHVRYVPVEESYEASLEQ